MKIKTIFTFTILLFTITTVSWSADKKNFTEADKQDFMKKYFDGEFKKKTSAPESLEEAAYNDAKSKNSVSSYLVYLLKYPEGKYFSKAYELSEIECNKSIKRGLESIFLEEGKVLDTKQIHKNFADKHYDDLSDIRVCIGFIDKIAKMVQDGDYIDIPEATTKALYLTNNVRKNSMLNGQASLKVYGKESNQYKAAQNVFKISSLAERYFSGCFRALLSGPKEIRMKTFEWSASHLNNQRGENIFLEHIQQMFKFEYDQENELKMKAFFKKSDVTAIRTIDQASAKESNDIVTEALKNMLGW